MASNVNTVVQHVVDLIKNNSETGALFADVTRAEFPICNDYPSCNVNAAGTQDDANIYGMGTKQRTINFRIHVSISASQAEQMQFDIWELVDSVREVIESDRFFNQLLIEPVIEINVRQVPSPIPSMDLLGCRVLEFTAKTREFLQL